VPPGDQGEAQANTGGDSGTTAGNLYPQPMNTAPYFGPGSFGATQGPPVVSRQAFERPLFGPQLMFETNIDDGLGFNDAYHRLNARMPYHVVPGNTVLLSDLSASITNSGDAVYNFGLVYRNYDASRNRIFGWNVYGDVDQSSDYQDAWYRIGAGVESLGKYVDFRANGYLITGDESALISSTLLGDLTQSGNNVFRVRNQLRENAYSGADFEIGGPLPIFGRRGFNMYTGAYYLGNEYGDDSVGVQARWQALLTDSATVNVNYSNDKTWGSSSWVSIAFTMPNYGARRFMQPKTVRERLADPVYRNNRIHTHIDEFNMPEAAINPDTGLPYFIVYVDPDATTPGTGTFEDPFMTMQQAVVANAPTIDVIRVDAREDDTGTNLTATGGLDLFNNQVLLSGNKDFTLFRADGMDFVIPATPNASDIGPLISDPTIGVGESVIRVANNNQIIGMRIDASNELDTVFATGVSNPLPFEDINLTCNTFLNYTIGADLEDGSGLIIVDENEFTGLAGASETGLLLTTAAGSTTDLLIRNNIASDNFVAGIDVTARPGATINADNPNAFTAIAGATVPATGIVGNTVTNGGDGIVMTAEAGSTINAVVNDNTSTDNTFNGFIARADGGTWNLASLANNTFNNNLENGGFLHYLNGGTFTAVSEDLNGDGILDAGEDLNGNGLLDAGIVSNVMNNNSLTGLCIFGEDTSDGTFDIGGPVAALGNTFLGNTGAGVGVDLQDDATAQIDALFNTIQGNSGPASLTIVLDFVDSAQGSVVDANGLTVNPFDVTAYGFAASDFDMVTNAILQTVENYYLSIPTVADNALSPIPENMQLDVDFVIGDAGVTPSNGATEYYAITIGDSAAALGGLAGLAADIGNIRNAQGQGPGQGISGVPQANGASAAGVYTNGINQFSPLLNPPDALSIPDSLVDPIIVEDPSQTPQYAVNALTSGNLTFTRRAIGLVTAHELGHTLSLRHIEQNTAVTPTGGNAIMATPAIDSPLQTLLEPAEFALSGTNPGELPGEAPFQQDSIAQLASAIGLRVAAGETNNGFAISGSDNARLIDSTFNNNTITGAQDHGINIAVQDNAQVEGLTIQGNSITGGSGHGIRLAADGNAFIDADNTIGGDGINVYGGVQFTQGNVISNNTGDGFRALASNGGTIHGNLINNTITGNGGNGASLLIENGGTIDFGTPASNRIISGNTITDNGAAGINLVSNVTATTQAQLDAVIQGNTITGNAAGGILANLNGPNNDPPAPPGVLENNIINLTVGGTLDSDANNLNGNADVGIGVDVTGNGKAVVDIRNSTISNTTDGANPLTNGDAINLRRSDSSYLEATIENVTATNNAGDGLDVEAQGNDKNDPNQPMTGTVNSVTWNDNIFSNNGGNGARFRVHGDAQLVADGQGNVVSDNAVNGILIHTSQTASFGDATDGLPPGRRVVFDGTTATGNGNDGIHILANNDSRALVEITSTRVAGSSGAHAELNTNGDTNISNNASDGVHLITNGGASDVLITSSTGQTTIDGNGTGGSGNGVRWDATGNSTGTMRVARTIISNSIAGATEDTNGDDVVNEDLNGDGILNLGEDANGNGILDIAEDVNENGDIDVVDGDGIQFNVSSSVFGVPTPTLIVGGIGDGNHIRNNQDDGIAITATGQDVLGVPRPIISIVDNTIGGEVDGIAAGNGGDGVSLNIFGGTDDVSSIGSDPASIDFSVPPADGDGLSPANGVTESGPIVQLTMTDNLVSNNNRKGVNLLLTGAAGERNREFGASTFDPVRITLTDNTIISNGEEGVFFRGDANMNQGRLTYLANFPFPNPPFNPADDRPRTFGFYDPTQAEFLASNAGSVNGNTAFSPTDPIGDDGFLNLRTVQNTLLTIRDNQIQNNGTNTVTGEGVYLRVGTGAYLAADVQDNTYGGNLDADFRTESFLSLGNTFNSLDNAGDGTFDVIYWDDSAQLDLRFQNNTGNQIDVSSFGALYTNADPLKAIVLGNIGVQFRDAGFFQVDNGNFLDDPDNTFINFGATQDIDGSFNAGGYNLRGIADPAWPNIGFAPFLP
jgi:hypothetical protein